MRRKLIGTFVLVLALLALLLPLTLLMSSGQKAANANDADHMVKPMIAMLGESPQFKANTQVEPILELEDAWAIEDARTESATPLVVGMRNGADEMGYDSESQTFYCTLGMEETEDWPQIALFAQNAKGKENLRVVWIDDYAYDYRSDAIREGYRYELLAYTDTEYAYFGVVFTGLPIVTLHVHGGEEALSEEDVPARIAVSGAGYEALNSGAWVHLRGGGFVKEFPKWSFRVEFHELTGKGDDKVMRSVLGMPADTDWLLLANAADATCSRNELAWSIWRDWNADGEAFMIQQTQMVEVFLDDEYVGIYQVMQRINEEADIVRMGGNLATDVVARVIKDINIGDKPVANWMDLVNYWAELRYAPQGVSAKTAFERFMPYVYMNDQAGVLLGDEQFREVCARSTNVQKMIEYFLYTQTAGLCYDNIFNNVYMWAIKENGHYVYYLSPWDMDMAFTKMLGYEEDTLNLYHKQTWRMLDMDIDGAQQKLWDTWNEKRATILTDDAMYQRFQNFEDWINRSGAFLRESEKWQGGAQELSLGEIQAFAVSHLNTIDRLLAQFWPREEDLYQEAYFEE